MFEIANYIEAGLWAVIGVVLLTVALRRRDAVRRRAASAGAVFLVFGFSDVIEVRTGAWWRPWWLLALKAVCVAVLLTLLWLHARERSRRAD